MEEQSYRNRLEQLKEDIISDIKEQLDSLNNPVDLSMGASDPYNADNGAVSIYQANKNGVLVEEYNGEIAFDNFDIETLVFIWEGI